MVDCCCDHSYEDAILEAQDGIFDKCHYCEYKGSDCRNQCMELKPIYNPNLRRKQYETLV